MNMYQYRKHSYTISSGCLQGLRLTQCCTNQAGLIIIHDGSRGYLQRVREHHTSEFRLCRCNDGFPRLFIYPFCRPRVLHGVSAPPGIPTEYACHLCRPNDKHTDNGKAVVDPFNPVTPLNTLLKIFAFPLCVKCTRVVVLVRYLVDIQVCNGGRSSLGCNHHLVP
ncbi:hypothetical protein EV401DRAFT_1352091 [Pisolithus croceorrhizus]|nr:hypothetical protein EV401DRAFT_1352091 [Pisolithus croceorrhizus]